MSKRMVALALFAWGSAACAAGRKDLGSIEVTAAPPRISTQVITEYTFHVTEGQIALESPGNPTAFDLTEEGDGCLRGNVNKAGNLREICRLPSSNGKPGAPESWKSTTSVLVFTVQLSADRNRILIDAGASHGEFALGKGAVADELREHPELLGAAFAYGYLPAANGTDDKAMLDYRYVVSSVN
jgi:hypothetical protein